MGTLLLTFAIIIEVLSCCLKIGALVCLLPFSQWSEILGKKLQHGEIVAFVTNLVHFKQHLNTGNR